MFWIIMKSKFWSQFTTTLRGRLTAWYLASTVLIFILITLAISGLFWLTLQGQIDHHLHIAVNEAHQIVMQFTGDEREALIKNLVSAQGMTVVVLSPDGAPLLETNSADVAVATEHQLQKILTNSSLYQTGPMRFTDNNIRFAAMPVQVNAGRGIVAVGYSTQILYASIYKLLGLLIGVVSFLIFPTTFIGYKLLQRQLNPLEYIARQAKSIAKTSFLSKRIRLSSPAEELRLIQEALNSMFSRLENIFKREREFFADAAHTLKTPLAVLRSQIESITITKKSKHSLLKTIDQANDTIQDLLFLSQINNSPRHDGSISLSALMLDLAELATTLGQEKGIKVFSSIQAGITLKADQQLLQRALGNIVHNAVIYNKPNGAVNLSLKKRPHQVTILVEDTGVGIKKSDQDKVFSRFFRSANAVGKGSGLGLAISKAVIENHGGRILLLSSVNKGTKVVVTFFV